MTYEHFRELVRSLVEEHLEAEPPVAFDEATYTWTRGAVRCTLTPSSDDDTVVASRTAADLFRVGNTLGIRQDMTEDGAAECAKNILGWLNNPSLYKAPAGKDGSAVP
jgi:hypothetical protein